MIQREQHEQNFNSILDNREARAVWDEKNAKRWFSVLDIISVLRNEDNPGKIEATANSLLESIEAGTVKGLQQIHAYLFEDYTILLDKFVLEHCKGTFSLRWLSFFIKNNLE